jgi:hypothetical protein
VRLIPSRDLDKFAASLSKALASFAPASPTAKEPFRDAFGIQISNFKYNQICEICFICVNLRVAKRRHRAEVYANPVEAKTHRAETDNPCAITFFL